MKPFIQSSAEDDILRQFEWYVEKGLPGIAQRFRAGVIEAVHALLAIPHAGATCPINNPSLAGLRTWPVKGFADFRAYYLPRPDALIIPRILHDKRDIGRILEGQAVEDICD